MSLITAWRSQRDAGARQALAKPAGRPPADPHERETARPAPGERTPSGRAREGAGGDRGAGKLPALLDQLATGRPNSRERADTIIDATNTDLPRPARLVRAAGRPQASHYRRHRQIPPPVSAARERKPQLRASSAQERALHPIYSTRASMSRACRPCMGLRKTGVRALRC